MASGNVSTVYISVIDDVVAKVREDFITYGVGDAVLNELQALWETKLMHCGAISGNIDRNRAPPAGASAGGATPPVHDLNVPYEATSEEYATPTADMLFPPVRQNPSIIPPNWPRSMWSTCRVLMGLVVFGCRRRCRPRSRHHFQGLIQGCITYPRGRRTMPHRRSVT